MSDLSAEITRFIDQQVEKTYTLVKPHLDTLLAKTQHQVDENKVKYKIETFLLTFYFGVKYKLEANTETDIEPTLKQYQNFLDTKLDVIRLDLTCKGCETHFIFNYNIQTEQVWAYITKNGSSYTDIQREPVPACEYQPTYDIELNVTSGKLFISDWLRIGNTELSALLGFNQFESELDKGMLASKLLYDKYKLFGLVSIHGTFPQLYLNTDYDLMFGSFDEALMSQQSYQNLESQGYRNLLIADLTVVKQLINKQYKSFLGNPSDFNGEKLYAQFVKEHKKNIITIPCGNYQGKVYHQDFPKYKDSYVYSYLNKVNT